VSDERRTDWNVTDPDLLPPFNLWPRWAVELDIEIADLIGDVGGRDEEDTAAGCAEIAAYARVREIIRSMV
jgi:hypothetical protein